MIYGNYRIDSGGILVRDGACWVDVAAAAPRRLLALRKSAIGYVSQFLRAIPRVSAIDLAAAAAREGGRDTAKDQAAGLLTRLNLPERLWDLPPATFSGGEQQRVNIARGFAAAADPAAGRADRLARCRQPRPRGRAIADRRDQGTAILGIFHDAAVRNEIADRIVDVTAFAA